MRCNRLRRSRIVRYLSGSFRRKLLASFIAISVVPLVLCGFVMITVFRQKLRQENHTEAMEEISQECELLTDQMGEISSSMAVLQGQEIIQRRLSRKISGDAEVNGLLYEKTQEARNFARFDLLDADGVCRYTTGQRQNGESLPAYFGILRMAEEQSESMAVWACRIGSGSMESNAEVRIRCARAVQDENGETVGYLTATVTRENLERLLAASLPSRDGILLVNRWYEEVYATTTVHQLDAASAFHSALFAADGGQEVEGFETYARPVGDTGLTLILVKRPLFDAAMEHAMRRLVLLFAAISLSVCALASVKVSQNFTKPILVMNRAMEEVKKGNLAVRISEGRTDELGQLSSSFNAMTERIGQNLQERIENEKRLNEVRIAMMQAQLNPHFLYNTLDSIKWLAKAAGVPEIVQLSSKLAKILRTAISGEPMITLAEEFSLSENYARIQNIRFADKFVFTFSLPASLRERKIPKLILQPIVENACIHGLEESDEGTVEVTAAQDDNCLILTVTDSGSGIPEDMFVRINTHNWEKIRGHLGLSNVDRIVRMHYGNHYGLRAERPVEGGTRIRILLPLVETEGGKQNGSGDTPCTDRG